MILPELHLCAYPSTYGVAAAAVHNHVVPIRHSTVRMAAARPALSGHRCGEQKQSWASASHFHGIANPQVLQPTIAPRPGYLWRAWPFCRFSADGAEFGNSASVASLAAMGVHFLAPAILGAGWPALPPGKPTNVTVLSGQTWASIRWASASQSEGGGETNHFSLKWQYKNGAEAEWFPYWVGPDQDEAMLLSLGSGVTIATRVAAVNQYGRTWSDFVVFST